MSFYMKIKKIVYKIAIFDQVERKSQLNRQIYVNKTHEDV